MLVLVGGDATVGASVIAAGVDAGDATSVERTTCRGGQQFGGSIVVLMSKDVEVWGKRGGGQGYLCFLP